MHDRRAVIIARSIIEDVQRAVHARRDPPAFEADSGWVIYDAGSDPAHVESWMLIAIEELARFDPAIAAHLDAPPGTVLRRDATQEKWTVVTDPRRARVVGSSKRYDS